jgi:hypothetical protein
MRIKTVSELARHLGEHRTHLSRLLKRPDAPDMRYDGYDVEEIRQFVASTVIKRGKQGEKSKPPQDAKPDPTPQQDQKPAGDIEIDWGEMALMKAEKLAEEVEKLKLHNQQKRGELIDRPTVIQAFENVGDIIRKTIINSGLDKIQQDRIFEALDRESDRLLSAIVGELEEQLPETGEA